MRQKVTDYSAGNKTTIYNDNDENDNALPMG